jgi:acetyl esterase/lipase
MNLLAALLIIAQPPAAPPRPAVTTTEDVIYGRKFGTALTMDVYVPKEKRNGAAVIYVLSGGWFSSKQPMPPLADAFLRRGYVVFAVTHGSQPRFTIPEVIEDMHRAVRFIRHNARKWEVDPERLGIAGGSAGGHLSLMQGCAPRGGNKTKDPVEGESSRVAAVACFFPPTDFLNYGKPGEEALGTGVLRGFKAPFDFVEMDTATRSFVLITDPERRREIGRRISPVNHVSPKSAPALIVHGDADKLVPIQQAELIIEKLKAAGVPCELVRKPGLDHGWKGMDKDIETFADWFDKHLAKKPTGD